MRSGEIEESAVSNSINGSEPQSSHESARLVIENKIQTTSSGSPLNLEEDLGKESSHSDSDCCSEKSSGHYPLSSQGSYVDPIHKPSDLTDIYGMDHPPSENMCSDYGHNDLQPGERYSQFDAPKPEPSDALDSFDGENTKPASQDHFDSLTTKHQLNCDDDHNQYGGTSESEEDVKRYKAAKESSYHSHESQNQMGELQPTVGPSEYVIESKLHRKTSAPVTVNLSNHFVETDEVPGQSHAQYVPVRSSVTENRHVPARQIYFKAEPGNQSLTDVDKNPHDTNKLISMDSIKRAGGRQILKVNPVTADGNFESQKSLRKRPKPNGRAPRRNERQHSTLAREDLQTRNEVLWSSSGSTSQAPEVTVDQRQKRTDLNAPSGNARYDDLKEKYDTFQECLLHQNLTLQQAKHELQAAQEELKFKQDDIRDLKKRELRWHNESRQLKNMQRSKKELLKDQKVLLSSASVSTEIEESMSTGSATSVHRPLKRIKRLEKHSISDIKSGKCRGTFTTGSPTDQLRLNMLVEMVDAVLKKDGRCWKALSEIKELLGHHQSEAVKESQPSPYIQDMFEKIDRRLSTRNKRLASIEAALKLLSESLQESTHLSLSTMDGKTKMQSDVFSRLRKYHRKMLKPFTELQKLGSSKSLAMQRSRLKKIEKRLEKRSSTETFNRLTPALALDISERLRKSGKHRRRPEEDTSNRLTNTRQRPLIHRSPKTKTISGYEDSLPIQRKDEKRPKSPILMNLKNLNSMAKESLKDIAAAMEIVKAVKKLQRDFNKAPKDPTARKSNRAQKEVSRDRTKILSSSSGEVQVDLTAKIKRPSKIFLLGENAAKATALNDASDKYVLFMTNLSKIIRRIGRKSDDFWSAFRRLNSAVRKTHSASRYAVSTSQKATPNSHSLDAEKAKNQRERKKSSRKVRSSSRAKRPRAMEVFKGSKSVPPLSKAIQRQQNVYNADRRHLKQKIRCLQANKSSRCPPCKDVNHYNGQGEGTFLLENMIFRLKELATILRESCSSNLENHQNNQYLQQLERLVMELKLLLEQNHKNSPLAGERSDPSLEQKIPSNSLDLEQCLEKCAQLKKDNAALRETLRHMDLVIPKSQKPVKNTEERGKGKANCNRRSFVQRSLQQLRSRSPRTDANPGRRNSFHLFTSTKSDDLQTLRELAARQLENAKLNRKLQATLRKLSPTNAHEGCAQSDTSASTITDSPKVRLQTCLERLADCVKERKNMNQRIARLEEQLAASKHISGAEAYKVRLPVPPGPQNVRVKSTDVRTKKAPIPIECSCWDMETQTLENQKPIERQKVPRSVEYNTHPDQALKGTDLPRIPVRSFGTKEQQQEIKGLRQAISEQREEIRGLCITVQELRSKPDVRDKGGHHEKSVRQERSIERQGPEDKNQRSRKTQTAAYFYKREGQEVIDPENSRTSYEQEESRRRRVYHKAVSVPARAQKAGAISAARRNGKRPESAPAKRKATTNQKTTWLPTTFARNESKVRARSVKQRAANDKENVSSVRQNSPAKSQNPRRNTESKLCSSTSTSARGEDEEGFVPFELQLLPSFHNRVETRNMHPRPISLQANTKKEHLFPSRLVGSKSPMFQPECAVAESKILQLMDCKTLMDEAVTFGDCLRRKNESDFAVYGDDIHFCDVYDRAS